MEVTTMRNETIRKLKNMRLPAFAEAYQYQINNVMEYIDMSFDERLMLLVDAEADSQYNNRIARLIKGAHFSQSTAFLGNIEYLPDRHLNRELITQLSDNNYVATAKNIILVGATGSGKTYIANAFGINACQAGYKTRYIRLPEFFSELEAARIQGKYTKVMKKFQNVPLLILDEFLLLPTSESEQAALLELMEYRCGSTSTIFCSQFMPEGWHQRLGNSVIADSILDRIIPISFLMEIRGDVSMRQRKSAIYR